jgi:histidyl-tRNA synthetase
MQPVRGTHDLLPEEFLVHSHIKKTAFAVMENFGFQGVDTPIFEFLEVFSRPLGDASDIVSKEMYTIHDKGGEVLALRPEGTAGVVRMLISNGLQQEMPLKLCYAVPCFRYERPQKGRQRQFHQIGTELFGADSFYADAEVISTGFEILKALGIQDQTSLSLNTIGDLESRHAYRSKLVNYLSTYKNDLSQDSQIRLEKNPMRILDSKDEGDKKILENAPALHDSLNAESRTFFDGLRHILETQNIPYTIDQRLVRGLDYYSHTVFEFVSNNLGAQTAVLGGGRYDGLVKLMGGQDIPGVGFGAGIERIALLLKEKPSLPRPTTIIPVSSEDEEAAWSLVFDLRKKGLIIDMGYSGNLSKRMKKASKNNARYCIVLSREDLAASKMNLKDMDSGEQVSLSLEDLTHHLFLAKTSK